MIYALYTFSIALFWTGLISVQNTTNQSAQPSTVQTIADNAGITFLAYRNALLTYITANPTLTGTIATNTLALPAGLTLPPGTGNNVIATASGNGRIIYAWATLPTGTLATLTNAQQGDPSLGIVNGTQWISPVYGPNAAVAPVFAPNRSTLSVQQIGN